MTLYEVGQPVQIGQFSRLLAEVREQGTGNREQKEELRLKASKTLYF
jgi:hypothetical protein